MLSIHVRIDTQSIQIFRKQAICLWSVYLRKYFLNEYSLFVVIHVHTYSAVTQQLSRRNTSRFTIQFISLCKARRLKGIQYTALIFLLHGILLNVISYAFL